MLQAMTLQRAPGDVPVQLSGDLTWYTLGSPSQLTSFVTLEPLGLKWPLSIEHYGKTVLPNCLIARVKNGRGYENYCMTCTVKIENAPRGKFTGMLSDFDPAPIDRAAFMNQKNVRKRDFVFEHTCTMQCQEMQIARGAVMIVIPVVDAYGRHGITSIPKAQVMLKYHEGKILAHQFCQLKASSELSIAVASVKEDTVEIRSVADQNHTMLKQLTEAVPAVVQEVDQVDPQVCALLLPLILSPAGLSRSWGDWHIN